MLWYDILMRYFESKYKRIYGKTIIELARKYRVGSRTICRWYENGKLSALEQYPQDVFTMCYQGMIDSGRIDQRIYKAYINAKQRCSCPRVRGYECYGGRGIKFLMTFVEMCYLWERDQAALMKQPSIDRIDNDGMYEVGNCRFIEMQENRSRRRGSHKPAVHYEFFIGRKVPVGLSEKTSEGLLEIRNSIADRRPQTPGASSHSLRHQQGGLRQPRPEGVVGQQARPSVP